MFIKIALGILKNVSYATEVSEAERRERLKSRRWGWKREEWTGPTAWECTVYRGQGLCHHFTAETGVSGPWGSVLCLVPGTFFTDSRAPLQKFTAGTSHLGLMILSHLEKGRMGTLRTKNTPGSGKESLGPVNEGEQLVSDSGARDMPCDSGENSGQER